ncbi:hypothetical protein BDZ45DRAFT_482080 [Acephala macrosclerotiorum]|nr:hypothetical protein BDZ45DRAFT_482080 [Acephala macrosclerotiorum]
MYQFANKNQNHSSSAWLEESPRLAMQERWEPRKKETTIGRMKRFSRISSLSSFLVCLSMGDGITILRTFSRHLDV